MLYSEDLAITGSRIWRHWETKIGEGSRVIHITEKAAHQHAQNLTFGLFAAAWLLRLTGWFHIHLFYSSKIPASSDVYVGI